MHSRKDSSSFQLLPLEEWRGRKDEGKKKGEGRMEEEEKQKGKKKPEELAGFIICVGAKKPNPLTGGDVTATIRYGTAIHDPVLLPCIYYSIATGYKEDANNHYFTAEKRAGKREHFIRQKPNHTLATH